MPHLLMRRTKDDGKPHAYANPFMVTMRYQCECTGGEVLQISTVFDLASVNLKDAASEQAFAWTMKRMFRDMQIEIEQHLKRPAEKQEGS